MGFKRADSAMNCKPLPVLSVSSTPSSQTVQAAAALGITLQSENQTDRPYIEACRLLNIAAAGDHPPYTGTTELPTMQEKVNTDPDVRNLSLIPMEQSVVSPKGTALAAPVRCSDDDRRNREAESACELGE